MNAGHSEQVMNVVDWLLCCYVGSTNYSSRQPGPKNGLILMLHVDQANYLYTMSSSAGFRVHYYVHVSLTSGEIRIPQEHLQFSFMWGVDYYQGRNGRGAGDRVPYFLGERGSNLTLFFRE